MPRWDAGWRAHALSGTLQMARPISRFQTHLYVPRPSPCTFQIGFLSHSALKTGATARSAAGGASVQAVTRSGSTGGVMTLVVGNDGLSVTPRIPQVQKNSARRYVTFCRSCCRYVHCVSISLDDANDATLVPDQKSNEAEELTESAPQTQEQSHRCGPQRLSCIAGGEC